MWLAFLLACGGPDTVPIPDTTARIDASGEVDLKESELALHIMTTPEDCEYIVRGSSADDPMTKREYEACLPWIDRQAGEVKLGVRFELDDQFFELPDLNNHMVVSLNDYQVTDNATESDIRVVGHSPVRIPQVFVLMIDGSASMNIKDRGSSQSRMDKVRDALLMRSVQEAFFPDGVNNHVLVYTFTSGTPQPLGGQLRVLSNKAEYKQHIQQHLKARTGYTHLYDAVDYGLNTVLAKSEVQALLDGNTKPTLVVLTDGFNNEASNDTCASNAPRLQSLMTKVRKEMDDFSVDTPLIFTVGLGKAMSSRFNPKKVKQGRINDRTLCGKFPYNTRIDAVGNEVGLEDRYIDNISLELIADRGKGRAFVKRDAEGLGEAFKEVAAIRYEWFEVMFRDNPLNFRREFNVRLQLNSYARSMSTVNVYPHAWMDGPHGHKDAEGWSTRGTMWHSASILTSGLGVLIFLLVFGAAVFNGKRLALGRLSRKSSKK